VWPWAVQMGGGRAGVGTWLFRRVMEPAAFLMTRRMLMGVKQRAEALRASRAGAARANHGAAA